MSANDKKIRLALSADRKARMLEDQAREARRYASELADSLFALATEDDADEETASG